MKWEKVKLGDLYTVHNGLSKGKKCFGTGFPFLSFSIVFNKWFIPEQLYDLVEVDEKERNSYSIKKGDVFITRTSETMEELGMSTVALKDYPNATYNGFTKRLRPITELLEPRFIGYYLRTPEFRGKFMAFSAMTTRASLTNDDLLSLEVPVPPLPVQKRIASILSAYDDLIENNQKQIKLLEEAAQRLYKEWFVDLRFPRHESVKIVDGVPEGWSSDQLIKLAEFKRGKTITKSSVKEGNVPVIAGGLEPAYFHNVANTVAPVITVSASGANAGYTALHNHNVWASDCSFIDSKICEHIYYVYNFLKTNKNMMLNLQKGSAQPHVYAKNINELILLIPEEKVLKEYSNKVEVIYKAIFHKSKQISSLREARDRLLPKLMSGEIEV